MAEKTARNVKLSKLGDDFVRTFMGLGPGFGIKYKTGPAYGELLDFGRSLRDTWLHQYSILPGAVTAYIEVAASREWYVTGSPRQASRAVEKLNKSFFRDDYGIIHEGFETVLSRLALDWLCVGRCAFSSGKTQDIQGPIEYLDSTYLSPVRRADAPTVWRYNPLTGDEQRDIKQDSVFFNDCVRLGATGLFIGKVAYTIPVARLDWYLREHDTSKLDGRTIRDIFFVADDNMVGAVEEALAASLSLAMGNTDSQAGFPVVSVNVQGGNGTKIEDMFARLGISEVPEEFNRENFEFRYANEISSALGLMLRYFWNDPRGTNRSLEQVNQERQSVQGPSFFVRSIARTINGSDVLNSLTQKVKFAFEEEVDSAAAERKADTLKAYAEAIQILTGIITPNMMPTPVGEAGTIEMIAPERLNPELMQPEAILSFLQRQGLLTTDITLPDLVTYEQDEFARGAVETLDKGEVVMNNEGRIVDRRSEFAIALSRSVKNGNNIDRELSS